MTERATGRHRASHRATTSSLSTLTGSLSVVGGRMDTVRRSGVIIAMSSGLVATMAFPAYAVTSGPAEVGGPQTASIPAVPAAGEASAFFGEASAFFAAPEGGLLSFPPGLALEDGTVSAPLAATLDFDHTAFVAVPTTADRAGARAGAATRAGLNDTQGTAATSAKAPTTRREARAAAAASSSASSSSKTSASSSSAKATTSAAKTATTTTTKTATTTTKTAVAPASGVQSAALAVAMRYLGTAYRYGGAKPGGFDCSGLVQYVYAQVGKKLPRTAAAQAAAVRHIPRSQAKPGDLVLFPGGTHIGIYVGNGKMLDAPHTGTVVQIRKIYSANVQFGRVS